MKYDTIDFKIKKFKCPWGEYDCCVILINGEELLPSIQKKEIELLKKAKLDISGAGNYQYLRPEDLYVYLAYTDLTHGDVKAPILSCSCGEVGCSCVKVEVDRLLNAVIWRNFDGLRKNWKYGLEFKFEPKSYNDFIKRLKEIRE